MKRRINQLSKQHRREIKKIAAQKWERWRINFMKEEPAARWRLLNKKVKPTTRHYNFTSNELMEKTYAFW